MLTIPRSLRLQARTRTRSRSRSSAGERSLERSMRACHRERHPATFTAGVTDRRGVNDVRAAFLLRGALSAAQLVLSDRASDSLERDEISATQGDELLGKRLVVRVREAGLV